MPVGSSERPPKRHKGDLNQSDGFVGIERMPTGDRTISKRPKSTHYGILARKLPLALSGDHSPRANSLHGHPKARTRVSNTETGPVSLSSPIGQHLELAPRDLALRSSLTSHTVGADYRGIRSLDRSDRIQNRTILPSKRRSETHKPQGRNQKTAKNSRLLDDWNVAHLPSPRGGETARSSPSDYEDSMAVQGQTYAARRVISNPRSLNLDVPKRFPTVQPFATWFAPLRLTTTSVRQTAGRDSLNDGFIGQIESHCIELRGLQFGLPQLEHSKRQPTDTHKQMLFPAMISGDFQGK